MELTTTSTIKCPGCGQFVDEAFYTQHINGDTDHAKHTLHTIEIKGVGTETLVGNQQKKQPKMLDLPYIGRVRADGIVVSWFIMLLLGILLGARII